MDLGCPRETPASPESLGGEKISIASSFAASEARVREQLASSLPQAFRAVRFSHAAGPVALCASEHDLPAISGTLRRHARHAADRWVEPIGARAAIA